MSYKLILMGNTEDVHGSGSFERGKAALNELAPFMSVDGSLVRKSTIVRIVDTTENIVLSPTVSAELRDKYMREAYVFDAEGNRIN